MLVPGLLALRRLDAATPPARRSAGPRSAGASSGRSHDVTALKQRQQQLTKALNLWARPELPQSVQPCNSSPPLPHRPPTTTTTTTSYWF
ncbi:unnamed protein product [Merluccius merluccius]